MGITLSQLYASKPGSSSQIPVTDFELQGFFGIPAKGMTGIVKISSTRYFAINQYVFLSDGINYGSFQIVAIDDDNDIVTLLNYGGKTSGSSIAPGGKILPSGFDAISELSNYVPISIFLTSLSGKLDNPNGTTDEYIKGDGSLADFSVSFENIAGLARNNADLASELEAIETNKFGTDNLLELQFWL